MKLAINRQQQDIKGTFGGHKGVNFSLSARAIFTPEEEQLIERYQMGGMMLHEVTIDKANEKTKIITIRDLRSGTSVTLGNLSELITAENQIKKGCGILKAYLEKAATFGGEEVIEI